MTTYGADTSHWKWSDGIDFAAMKRSGRCDYLFAKASEGVGYADPSYGGWRSGAKGAGMLFGSFHFARPGDPVAQADYYLSVAKPAAGELVSLDLEDLAISDAGNFGAAFCQRVQANTGTWPLLYTYPAFLATRDLSPIQRLGVQLWFADYTDPLNSIAPWSSYAIRQFTSNGGLPGLPAKDVDLNSSPLTIDQLRALAVGAAPQEDDMTPQQAAQLQAVNDAVAAIRVAVADPTGGILKRVAVMQGQITALTAAVAALPGGGTVDAATIEAAAHQGAHDALTALGAAIAATPA